MRIKEGVRIHGLRAEMLVALMVAEGVYRANGHQLVVTSAIDGKHSRGSRHYSGLAVDLRTRNIPVPEGFDPKEVHGTIRDLIAKNLGPDFDVVLESDHIHLEHHAKTPY
jgi:hypothetical protein